MGDVKQTNFRIDQETAEKFRDFCEENGMSQAQGFDHVMQVVELDKAKAATPGRITEIESFEKSVKDIMAAYLNSIEINNNTEARIREQFNSALSSKDKTISDLQIKVDNLQEAKKIAEQTAEAATKSASQAIKDEEVAREQADTATKLAAEKDKTIATLADKLSLAEEKSAGYDALKKSEEQGQITIAGLRKDIEQLNADIITKLDAVKTDHDRKMEILKKDHEAEIKELVAEMEILKKDHKTEIRELTTEMERKISDTAKDAALATAQAVTNKEREMMEQIRQADKENAKLSVLIEQLQKENEKLKKEH